MSGAQEVAHVFEERIELVVMYPMAGALDVDGFVILKAVARPSFSGSEAHDSVPRTSSIGQVIRLQMCRASCMLNRYGDAART